MPALLVARLLPSRPHLSDWQRPQQPAPSLKLLFLLAVLVSSSLPQSVPGYSNVNFVYQPEDLYSLTGTSATFECLAQGVADNTGDLEYLDMLVYFNGQLIDKFNPPPGMKPLQMFQKVAGLFITSTEPQQNNASVYCKVKDSEGEGLFSQTALLIVADGEPAAVVPTQVFQGLYEIRVMWEPALTPMEGPVLNYTASLTGPVQQQKEAAADVTSLLFEGLLPARNYSLAVVASNEYGKGNITTVIVSTKSPIVPTAPGSVSVEPFPANSALVTWTAVMINNQTMTPVIYYNITYFPVSNPSFVLSKNTVDANELQMMLYNLTLGEVYMIKVSAVNSAGQGESFILTTTIAVPMSTPSSTQASSPSGSGLLLIIVPAVIAGLIVIAIIIIAIMIIVMCVLSIRKDNMDLSSREITNESSWQTQRPSLRKPKEKEHEASLKESYSGSTDRSFGSSDSSEMPTLAIHSTSSSATNGNYCVTIPDEDGTTV